MFRENSLKRRLASGDMALGAWIGTASPIVAEIMAMAGYDALVIDQEHGPGTLGELAGMLRAAQATPCTALVRVPWNDAVAIKRTLDLGAEGIMIPSVNSAEEARAAVAACLYPPDGTRGAAYSVVRAADYGMTENYDRRANAETLIICQIETAQAVEALPDIAKVPGIDMLFIGPWDLSGSIGRLGRFDDPAVRDLFDRAERAILDTGIAYGTLPNPLRTAEALAGAGCRFIVAGHDVALLRDAARAQVAGLRRGRV